MNINKLLSLAILIKDLNKKREWSQFMIYSTTKGMGPTCEFSKHTYKLLEKSGVIEHIESTLREVIND